MNTESASCLLNIPVFLTIIFSRVLQSSGIPFSNLSSRWILPSPNLQCWTGVFLPWTELTYLWKSYFKVNFTKYSFGNGVYPIDFFNNNHQILGVVRVDMFKIWQPNVLIATIVQVFNGLEKMLAYQQWSMQWWIKIPKMP